MKLGFLRLDVVKNDGTEGVFFVNITKIASVAPCGENDKWCEIMVEDYVCTAKIHHTTLFERMARICESIVTAEKAENEECMKLKENQPLP